MKSKARSYVWWPSIDSHLEDRVKECVQCQLTRHAPPLAPLQPWEWPQQPWSRIHVDYAGPFQGKMFLIVVDAHSKWMEVAIVNSATSSVTIEKLRSMFATHGLPVKLVSDNGSAFTSHEFEQFLQKNAIQHSLTAPYHPASNGQVERAVQTFKEGMKRSTSGSLETRVSRFLFNYRITPHTTTGVSPAEMMFGRQLRSHLSLLHLDIAASVAAKQQSQKRDHDRSAKPRCITVGDQVFVRDFPVGSSWLPGVVEEKRGPYSFIITLEDGRSVRRHLDHIRLRREGTPAVDVTESSPTETDDFIPRPALQERTETPLVDNSEEVEVPAGQERTAPAMPLRRSTRDRHQVDRYEPTW